MTKKQKVEKVSYHYNDKKAEEWIQLFREDYLKIKPHSAAMYNSKRNENLPGWQTIAKYIGVTRWLALLEYCELTAIKPIRKQTKMKQGIYVIRRECQLLNLIQKYTDCDIV